MNEEQKQEVIQLFTDLKNYGSFGYRAIKIDTYTYPRIDGFDFEERIDTLLVELKK